MPILLSYFLHFLITILSILAYEYIIDRKLLKNKLEDFGSIFLIIGSTRLLLEFENTIKTLDWILVVIGILMSITVVILYVKAED
jgi:hypothetical protein